MTAAGAWQASPSLLSGQWFRVARLRPALEPSVQVRRMVVRGEVWHALVRADGARSLRMNTAAWDLIGRCDGVQTLQRLWEGALQRAGDGAPSQDEVLGWLVRLQAAGFLSFDRQPEFGRRGDASPEPGPDAAERGEARSSWMAWRWPLGRPDAFLQRLSWRLDPLLGWPALPSLLVAAVALLVLLSFVHRAELQAAVGAMLMRPSAVLAGLLVYPVVKLLHEVAHGVVARWHGAPVPEWGLMFLVGMPAPYVEASAASALPRAGQRLAVSAAGIVVEALLALLGLAVALTVEPGVVRDLGLTLFFIGAVSTLAVNGNPLMRFDGYHMLCDAAGLPNLAPRSQRWWAERLRRRWLGLDVPQPLSVAPGETPWLAAYAPLAALMRWVVSLALLAWAAGLSGWLALALAVPLGFGLVVQPAWRLWQGWRAQALPHALRRRLAWRTTALAVVLLGVLAAPWPYRTVVQGVWWQPEDAMVRTQVEGVVAEVLVRHGQLVRAGQPLLRLQAPALETEAAQEEARLAALQGSYWQSLRDDPARAVQAGLELAATRAALERAQRQLADLWVRAPADGRVALPGEVDLPGRWLARGTRIGHLATDAPPVIQVAIPHEQAARVAQAAPEVQVWRASGSGPVLAGRWDRQLSGGGAALPSAALSERAGGAIATDPADEHHQRPLQAVALAEIRLLPGQPEAAGERIGERAWVRFDHGRLPLAVQALIGLQQLVLRHLRSGP